MPPMVTRISRSKWNPEPFTILRSGLLTMRLWADRRERARERARARARAVKGEVMKWEGHAFCMAIGFQFRKINMCIVLYWTEY
jgi:hypothetical protein